MPRPAQAAALDPARLSQTLLAAATVALAGSLALGVLETALVVAVIGRHLDEFPVLTIAAAIGKVAITHLLVWLPTMLLVAVCGWAVTRRRWARPAGPLVALFLLLAGAVVAPAELALAERCGPKTLTVALIVVLVASASGYFITNCVQRLIGARWFRRGLLAQFFACLALLAGLAVVFARSPLANPAAFKLASPTRIPDAGGGAPNVVWIVLDTVRGDRFGRATGSRPAKPRLDEFATSAVVYPRAVANGIWTVPSHAAMFTGLSVREHGADHGHLWLDDRFETLAERLHERGYRTASFSNNPFISRDTNLAQGFDLARVMWHWRYLGRFSLEYLCERSGWVPPLPWLDGDYGAALTNQLVAGWLNAAPADRPFFLFVNYMEAHLPYRVPAAFRRRFMKPAELRRSYELRQRAYGNIVAILDGRFNFEDAAYFAESDREVMRRQYDAAVSTADARAGELLDWLAARGLLEQTLVVITSDHGEHLGGHGLWGHRFMTYQDLAHVGLMLRAPGRPGVARPDVVAQPSDLYFTVLKYAGVDVAVPDRALDLLDPPADAPARFAIVEYNGAAENTAVQMRSAGRPEVRRRALGQTAVVAGRYKYIASLDGRRELFDLQLDPGETTNLLAQMPEEAERLDAFLRRWRETTPPRGGTSQPGVAPDLPEDTLRAMKALGYIDDGGG